MNSKFNLLAGASMGIALIAGATPALAVAKKKPVHHAAKVAPKGDRRDAEIDALRHQLEALTARLDSQEAAQHQTQATAEAAQTQAATAATTAQAAQTQAAAVQQSVPTEVKTALAKQPKAKNEWANNTSISGRAYMNFSNISAHNAGVNSPNNGTGFNLKRFYLSVDHTFDSTFSADLTTDVSNVLGQTNFQNPAAATATSIVGKGLFIKKAYLQAKLNPAFIIRFGSADLPWVPYVENQYGYRHIENILIDRTSFGTSADWGVHVLGDLAGGLLSYQVSVVDGGGYRNVKVTNSVDIEGRVSAQYKGAYAAVGGYTGKLGNNTQGVKDPHTATRLDGLIGYKNKLFNVGGEYFWAKNYNNNGQQYIIPQTNGTVLSDKSEGYSFFGNINFAPKWSVFGRYDYLKPRKELASKLKDHYYNAGVQYSPAKIVDIALVYKREIVDGGTIATQNGPIGVANGTRGTYNEVGVFTQFRF